MNSLKSFEPCDGIPYLLLSDKNEYCFESGSMNWEHFIVNAIIYSPGICVISNSRGHHVNSSNADVVYPMSFVYVPTHCLWLTESSEGEESKTIIGSMKIYSAYSLKYKGEILQTVKIYGKDMLCEEEANDVIEHIKAGATFRLNCSFENGTSASFSVDLPMVNEKGQFRINIKPFFGILDSILNPKKISKFIESKITFYNENRLTGMPDFFENEEIVSQAIKSDRRLMPSFAISFSENKETRFCEPSNIISVLEQKNTALCVAVDRRGEIERNIKLGIIDCRICIYS